MELLDRRYFNPQLDLGFSDSALLHPRYHFLIRERRNIVADDRLWSHLAPPLPQAGRRHLIVQLDGEAVRRHGGHSHHDRPGDASVLCSSQHAEQMHQGSLRYLRLDWDPAWLGGGELPEAGSFALSSAGLRRLRALVSEFQAAATDRRRAPETFRKVVELLRSEGLELEPEQCHDLRDPVPEAQTALARALDRSFSSLGKRLSMIDLEAALGWSRNRVQYEMKKMCETYRIPEGHNFRSLSTQWRILAGSFLMSSPLARTERVAEELGYASARAFCNALSNAGLPSPGAIRESLLRMS